MERWRRAAKRARQSPLDDLPFALTREGPHGPVIHATNPMAELGGVLIGSRAVDARALCPALMLAEADPAADAAALRQLALWARRWCPWSATDGADGLVLDTTGSAHLCGGEAGLLADIEARLSSIGFSQRAALAPTWGAAWAMARFGPHGAQILSPEDMASRLAPLPVRALRLEGETLLLLRRLGFKTVGSLLDIPRMALTRRFSRIAADANPLLRLDQALGRLPEPVNSPDEPAQFRALVKLAEPIHDIAPHLPDLARQLAADLARQNLGARRLRLWAFRVDGDIGQASAATSAASHDADHLVWLLGGQLAAIDPGYGFDALLLEASDTEPIRPAQPGLDSRADSGLPLPALVDRLIARLGAQSVLRPMLRESHIPERAELWVSALTGAPDTLTAPPVTALRPARLLDVPAEIIVLYAVPEGPPAQFIWWRKTHRVTRYAGPERIAPEWWHDRPGTRLRDYYRIETEAGARYWIFRQGVLGDGRGAIPRWFLHGFFA